jgi:hypothetical protein
MSQSADPLTSSSNSALPKIAVWAGLIAFMVIVTGSRDASSVEVWGVSVPMWLLVIVLYLLGAVTQWGSMKSRKKSSR